jgi:hypothetical protein
MACQGGLLATSEGKWKAALARLIAILCCATGWRRRLRLARSSVIRCSRRGRG